MINAVIFDLDNTLVDFMAMKRQAVDAAIEAMRDAGLELSADEIRARIDEIYKLKGIEFQNVFDELLYNEFSKIDYKILSSGVIALKCFKYRIMKAYFRMIASYHSLGIMVFKGCIKPAD